jgi:hypothetical protein
MQETKAPPADEPDSQAAAPVAAGDRRRPGRTQYRNPWLLALLRRQPAPAFEPMPAASLRDQEDGLSPARGIIIGVAMAAVLWSIIGLAAWSIARLI